jgi:hypothetical protein
MEELLKYMQLKNRLLILSEVRPAVLKVLKNSGILHTIGVHNIFADNKENPTLSTAKALKHAREQLGNAKPQIRIVTTDIGRKRPLSKIISSLRTMSQPFRRQRQVENPVAGEIDAHS